jgi:phosphoglycerate kinase
MINYEQYSKQLYRIFSSPELDAISLEQILSAIPTVDQLQDIAEGTTVLVRAELDMPIADGKVADRSRILATVSTIKYCIEKGWKTILFGHVGRDKDTTVLPVWKSYIEEVGHDIQMVSDWLDEPDLKLKDEFVSSVSVAKPGTIFMLENTRKYDIERAMWTATEDTFDDICGKTYKLAIDIQDRLAKVLINEAIAASNFDFSSAVLPLVMNTTALGFSISKELKEHIAGARRSNLAVISGLKLDKLDALEKILERKSLKYVIVAGSLAMVLKKAKAQLDGGDFNIGLAETDENQKFYVTPSRLEQGKRIVKMCAEDNVELILPIDFILDNGEVVSEGIPVGHQQLDVGPKSRELVSRMVDKYIAASQAASEPFTMYYNGVFGMFEDSRYETATKEFIGCLRTMTEGGVKTYVGGGEGRLALLKYGNISDATHVFTAGGTVLKSLTNKHIAYLKAMYLQQQEVNIMSCEKLIEEFKSTNDLQKMETLADELGETGDNRAIDILLYRVGDIQTQEDDDVHESICGALVNLGVMRKLGNLNYLIEDESKLSPEVKEMLEKYKMLIPRKYFTK